MVSGALKQIPAKYQDKVVAVVLYGAGDGSGVAKPYYEKALANCAPGDFVSVFSYRGRILMFAGLPEGRKGPGTRFVQQQGDHLA